MDPPRSKNSIGRKGIEGKSSLCTVQMIVYNRFVNLSRSALPSVLADSGPK